LREYAAEQSKCDQDSGKVTTHGVLPVSDDSYRETLREIAAMTERS
jgi:hypothetical protein